MFIEDISDSENVDFENICIVFSMSLYLKGRVFDIAKRYLVYSQKEY